MRAAERRKREARKGALIIAACAALFLAMICGAYSVDSARGMTAGESLASWGL